MSKRVVLEYNYHHWTKHMVRQPEDKPVDPHYAAVLFDTRTEYSPAYDSSDYSSASTVHETHYFRFYAREELEMWVAEATRSNKKFFFFHVAKLGEATVKVDIDVSA